MYAYHIFFEKDLGREIVAQHIHASEYKIFDKFGRDFLNTLFEEFDRSRLTGFSSLSDAQTCAKNILEYSPKEVIIIRKGQWSPDNGDDTYFEYDENFKPVFIYKK